MRTTLDIDDDVLAAAKELARVQGRSAGHVVSVLLRKALTGDTSVSSPAAAKKRPKAVAGFEPFASRGKPVTNEAIDRLRDAEGV